MRSRTITYSSSSPLYRRPSASQISTRSASPSSAMPRSASAACTACASCSACSAPTPSLMFSPLGDAPCETTSAPSSWNTCGRDVVGRAVGTVDDELQSLEIEVIRKRALAELDITARGIVEPAHLAEPARIDAVPRLVEFLLDAFLDGVGQLGAALGEELDAVVRIRIVRSADDDAGIEPQCAGEVGHGRRRQRSAQHDVDPCARETRFERRLEHVTRDARVLADQHGRPGARRLRPDAPARARPPARAAVRTPA